MTHPLIGDPAGKFFVEAKLAINLRIEWPIGFVQKKFAPVGILFADLFAYRPSAPARTVVVPDNLNLADVAEHTCLHQVVRCPRMWFAAVLCSDLDDAIIFLDRIPRSFCFFKHIAHRLFDVGVLPGFGGHLQQKRMSMVWSRKNDSVDLRRSEDFFNVRERPRCASVIFLICFDRLLAIQLPEIADAGHLDILFACKLRDDPIQVLATAPVANVTQGDAVVGADNSAVRKRRFRERRAACNHGCRFRQKLPAING